MSENEAQTAESTQITGWQRFWTQLLSTEVQLILATFTTLAIILVVAWVGINEPARMAEFDQSYNARSIENGAVLFDSTCAACHGPQGQGITGIAPPLNHAALFNGERLEEVGWTGSLEDFVRLTVAAGRPTSTEYAQPMPTWGLEFGGPLRPDQVQDVTNFILNWEQTALSGVELAEVEPTPAGEGEGPIENYVGMDTERPLPEGDPVNGQALFEGVDFGCSACHVAGAPTTAPAIVGVASRAAERVEGLSAEQYIRESIQKPEAFMVDGYTNLMSAQAFGDRMTEQQLADLMAYLLTLE